MDSLTNSKKRKSDDSPVNLTASSSTDNTFPRFLVIESIESAKLSELSPFIIEKTISSLIGTAKSVRKMRNGALLVEVSRPGQAECLLGLKKFFSVKSKCYRHQTLNSCKGVIRCSDLANTSDAEITTELGSQNVCDVERISVTRDGKRSATNTSILTFSTPILPSSILVGYLNVRVDVYIPNPLQCYCCYRFGHHERSCTSQSICRRCGLHHEDKENCTEMFKCVNCDGAHGATSRFCPIWNMEKEVLRIKYTQSLSFPEARKIVLSTALPPHPNSYANVTKRKIESKDCGVQVNLCDCTSPQSIAIQTSNNELAISESSRKTSSKPSVQPKSSTKASSPSPERVIQRQSPTKKIVLTDRVKKAQRDPILSSNRYEALLESDVQSMEDEDLGLSPPRASPRGISPIKCPR